MYWYDEITYCSFSLIQLTTPKEAAVQRVFQASCSAQLHRCVALFETRWAEKQLPGPASQTGS